MSDEGLCREERIDQLEHSRPQGEIGRDLPQ
jgi:hypothetical protein